MPIAKILYSCLGLAFLNQTINTMLRNYLKIAFRNLLKNKSFSLINIFGLAVGMAACILMLAYVQDELSYDKFHEKGDRIYRLTYSYQMDAKDGVGSKMTFPAKAVLLEEYPEVEKVVRFYSNNSSNNFPLLRYEDKAFTEDQFLFADPEVFEVFDFQVIEGDSKAPLELYQNVLLTQKAANKYFGDESPVGKTIRYQNETDLNITGIVKDPPGNSHIQFEFLAPVNLQRYKWMGGPDGKMYDFETDWNWAGCWLFVQLKEHADPKVFEEKIQAIAKEYFDEDGKAKFALHLQSLQDIHFNAFPTAEMSAGGNRTQVYGLTIIAFLILLIACINFMNLATAKSTQRSREVGVRKVLGARRGQLIRQFLGEAMIISFLAIVLAGVIAELLLPGFNALTNKQLAIDFFQNPEIPSLMISGALLVGLFSGSYPSLFLSKFKPIQTLRGQVVSSFKGIGVRKALVITQFAISTALIIGVFVIWQQLDFLRNKDLGFNQENTLMIKNGWKISDSGKYDLLKTKMEANPEVKSIYRGYVPGMASWSNSFEVEGKEEQIRLGMRPVGYDFFDVFDIEMVAGRAFSEAIAADSTTTAIINEKTAKQIGLSPEEVLGKTISYTAGSDNQTRFDLTIVGVAKNANFESLYKEEGPLIFRVSHWGELAIKVHSGNIQKSLKKIEKTWNEVSPDWPFEYTFMDETLAARYEKDVKLGTVIQAFALLAIFIACMGLLGLSAFMVEQRTKEIGIRKILGASVSGIVSLLSKDFLKLAAIAIFVAAPLGWYFMKEWLQDFAYRIELNWWVFILAGLSTVLIAFLTVSLNSIRAALSNPVETLKVE